MPFTNQPLPSSPSLVAILLVTKGRTGPRLVYHYPPNPSIASSGSSRNPAWYGTPGTSSDLSDTSDSDASSDSDSGHVGDDGSSRAGSRSSGGRGSSRRDTGSGRSGRTRNTGPGGSIQDVDEDMPDRSKNHIRERDGQREQMRKDSLSEPNRQDGHDGPEWQRVLGFSAEGLGKLLAPARSFNKRRFELGIDQLVFLGAPRFIRDDGLWKKKRRQKRKNHSKDTSNVQSDNELSKEVSRHGSISSVVEPKPGPEVVYDDVIYGPAYGHGLGSDPSDVGSESKSTSTNGVGSEPELTMFNVVFVLNPSALEYHDRVDEMYDNVVKKFAKALKFAQSYNNYIHGESRAIWAMKEKAKENHTPMSSLWSTIAQNSSLARAIMVTYDTICDDGIAHVNLGRDFDTSFQLPQPVSVSSVGTPNEAQMPGLWLTTATPWEDDETDSLLSPHCALLLLEDDDVLLEEVQKDAKELSAPLAHFIRNLTPEKSLLKVAAKSQLTTKDAQHLARHLIYWRRARAIPPLRERDTYIVSPNANMRNLKEAIPNFAAHFPLLPSLPTILQQLSGIPRPWSHFFPSRDHRDKYMIVLAWLMRHGWVTQLRTFGWIRVSPSVKLAVATRLDLERRNPRSTTRSIGSSGSPYINSTYDLDASISTIRAPSLSPFRPSAPSNNASPMLSSTSAHDHADDTANVYSTSIIHSPQGASAVELKWIEYIGSSFSEEDSEAKELWPTLLKYFDGKHAFEEIYVREGLKKRKVAAVLGRLASAGLLVSVKHW
ncbi:UPF0171-domain-containing protein [Microthyrium microscopicum]|uniref:Nitrogen permease regulator 3 n=1 Tax=Microthyrium microscopicum TaxID=703497 RepID=A0A6A6U9E1_9PEZI|nr:UPF0171-domain-containing protein [Microthyrium microscopicum]